MTDLLKLEKRGHTAIITLQNPPANTWTLDSLRHLRRLMEELNQDKDNYALVIASDSEKFFSAGADLNACHHQDYGKAFEFTQCFGNAFEALTNYKGVSIAAISGYAMGGGLEVALACDVRICEEQAQMALPEASVGLLPCGLGSQHLAWLVGEQWAKRLILLGERINAAKAEQIGLVSEVVAKGGAFARALELAAMTEKQSPTAIRFCKELIMEARNNGLDNAFVKERERFARLWDDENQLEGVSAFLEKRKPEWK